MTTRTALAAAVLFAAVPLSAHADHGWQQYADPCFAAIEQKTHCGSCGGIWPMVADCIAVNTHLPRSEMGRLQICKQQIWDRRWRDKTPAAYGDPIAESLACAGVR